MTTLDQIGDYEILNRIAHGGMGTVFLATHKGLRRHVALKVLSPQVNQDQEFIARFRREAHVIASLDHPHIVRVHDAGCAENYYFIAMEYLNYGTLKDRVKKFKEAGTPMAVVEVLEITRQIATALDHAHKKGVIHRDVKPSNIMIASGGRHVLSDFGIVFVQSGTRLTRSHGQLIGTAEYMSPEQADQRPYDHRVDIYALGVVMYELLTGTVPYTGDTEMIICMGISIEARSQSTNFGMMCHVTLFVWLRRR
ncbi:MAG: serine/threonine protein kinase [Anaerolineae bacterium]|nr:serine/threonine protein kinase [Anaerolineae bacterium]